MKHPHAELMHSLADNCQQMWRYKDGSYLSDWRDGETEPPHFFHKYEYQLKPKTKMLTRTVGPYPAPETVAPKEDAPYWRVYLGASGWNSCATTVNYAIDLQTDGGGFVEVVNKTLTGKSIRKYEISHRIALTGTGPWDIRVRRITADSSDKIVSNSFLAAVTEIVDGKLRYPNSAIFAYRFDSAQFQSIPVRSVHIKLKKVQIPSNYNPLTRAYTGSWDGTFTTAWSDNPAWCFYDLLTNTRYGLGQFLSVDQVDKWSLYSIGRYCDELVPDGFGGTEPRFTCNMYLQTQQQAYTVINAMASIFRGMPYWAGGAVQASQDAPSDAVHLYAPANVIDGSFTYEGSSAKARHTVALVTWNDPTDYGRQKVEYVEDIDSIARYGIITSQVTAVACSSRGQANRVGRWLLYSERYQTEIVRFRTGIEGAVGRPGQIIKVADPNRAGVRLGGRITASTINTVTLDASVTLEAGVTYTLSMLTEAGTVIDREVTTGAGATSTLMVTPDFDIAPAVMQIWMLSSSDVEPQLFRIIGIVEAEKGIYEFSALAHNASKYDAIEQGLQLETPQISTLRAIPESPQNLAITESLYESLNTVKTLVSLSWDTSEDAASYIVSYSIDGSSPTIARTTANELEIEDAAIGTYAVSVVAVSVLGLRSTPSPTTAEILGKTAAPRDLTNFNVTSFTGAGYFTWDLSSDLDVRVGGNIEVRHSPLTTGATWDNSIRAASFPGGSITGIIPLLSGTYLAKALDSSGNYSANAVSVVTNLADIIAFNFVETIEESPDWGGTKTNCEEDTGLLKISRDGGDLLYTSAEYLFEDAIDLGGVYTSRVTASLTAALFNEYDLWDDIGDVDALASIDGDIVAGATATVYLRTTMDDPTGSPTWSEWQPILIGDYTAWGFEFKAILEQQTAGINIALSQLSVTVDMPDRVEAGNNVTVAGSGLHIDFAAPFHATPAIAVTARDMATGDYLERSNEDETGFDVIFKNAAGTGVSRVMDWVAKGYGFLQP